MKELKVKIWNYKNVVLFEVLDQDESLREKGEIFRASNGINIKSSFEPCIGTNDIYIKGTNLDEDNIVDEYKFSNIEEAEEYVKKVKQAVNEFNGDLGETELTQDEKEELKNFTKQYEVTWLRKNKYNSTSEFIQIALINRCEDKQYIDLPLFKTGTRYNSMEQWKSYKPEELGLE